MFEFDLVVVFLILIVVGYICSALALFFLNRVVLLLVFVVLILIAINIIAPLN
jgi:hypothetical protein